MKPDDKNQIGKLIEGKAFRDAVHVAVAPCVAGQDLEPGEHVAFDSDGTVNNHMMGKVGVIDPFLIDPVKKGEQCWLFLYPGTALNLRHEWDHPAFRSQPETTSDQAASRMWLTIYAETHKLKLEDLLAGVEKYVADGCDVATLEDNFGDYEVPDDFWKHYSVVTGKTGSGNFWGCCI